MTYRRRKHAPFETRWGYQSVEYAPSSEVATGDTWGGAPVYRQHFSGTTLGNGTTLVAGVAAIVRIVGWSENQNNKLPSAWEDGTNTNQFYVDTSNNLKTSTTGGPLNNDYAFSLEYTKSG